MVCFEATGGHEWRLWASLEAAGIEARQLAPAQVKSFGRSRGTLAKTDRIDAELIACFMAFRPEAGRRLPSGKLRDLRALTTKRKQLVEMRKSARQQIKANLRNGTAEPVEDLTDELLELLERQIAEVEERIRSLLANDAVLAETAAVLRSVPGIGLVACAMPVAEMPELGRISGEQAAALAGLAPVARDSGQMRGKRTIGGGRAWTARRSASFWIGASRFRPIRRGSRGRGSWSRTRAISRTRSGTARICPDAGCSGRSRSSATKAAMPR